MATLKPPRGLSRPAKTLFQQVVADHPHLTSADTPLLTIYVKLYTELATAVDLVAETGSLATSEKGRQYMSPPMQVVSALSHRVVRLARELGLTVPTRPKGASVPAAATKGSAAPRFRVI